MKRTYVDVTAKFDSSGNVTPLEIQWVDGRKFEVDRVLDVRPAASLKVGGQGIRYTCRILGHETYLFFEDNTRWFVEAKG
ncbi:hypothetical protein EDD70_0495 [Hydrogenoanaerobacterium saccharovorans]|uniref:Uncharacterized protein n=1 Tax=Hydrogenoanaerobacterium saccharovorans TaxID=474960 RepID=A0A1H8AZL4_9FIRM|nr:hypothetical protein [Hydrogenoanaerobacterium saccharovorans]RPF47696.1 hypothetical protein EDD70_0495 [Hydrogenoanaerobacterium saccharovorans]SEM75344.1 hypothetical protein SAMN05216180_1596 [Hydrogenoanaerobacterium saccharovorans]